MMFLISLALVASVAISTNKYEIKSNATAELSICGYEATCSAGGYTGASVCISAGCCNGGSVTGGLCPGIYSLYCVI